MKCFLIEKVRFKLPGKPLRFIWAVVVAERDGLSLLWIKAPDSNWQDTLTVAIQNPQERCYEEADRFVFPIQEGDLLEIGGKLQAIGREDSDAMMRRMFEREDLF